MKKAYIRKGKKLLVKYKSKQIKKKIKKLNNNNKIYYYYP